MISEDFFFLADTEKWKMNCSKSMANLKGQLVRNSILKTEKIEFTSYNRSYVFKAVGYITGWEMFNIDFCLCFNQAL